MTPQELSKVRVGEYITVRKERTGSQVVYLVTNIVLPTGNAAAGYLQGQSLERTEAFYFTYKTEKYDTIYGYYPPSAFSLPTEDEIKHLQTNLSKRELGRGPLSTVGADPEIFIVDATTKALIPAFTVLPDRATNKYTYWDGFAGEGTPACRSCLAQWVDQVQDVLSELYVLARKTYPNATLTLRNTFRIPLSTRRTALPEHVELGCAESFNAYGTPSPLLRRTGAGIPWRSAGGHIHFGTGWAERFKASPPTEVVKALDCVLGLIGVSMAANLDNPIRRKYYGLAGEYRLPKHGLEYRVLSNFWLAHPAITHLIFEYARVTFGAACYGGFLWTGDQEDVRTIINTHDVDAARKMLRENQLFLKHLLKSAFSGANAGTDTTLARRTAAEVIFHPIEDLIDNAEGNFVMNWKLGMPNTLKNNVKDYTAPHWQYHSDGHHWTQVASKVTADGYAKL